MWGAVPHLWTPENTDGLESIELIGSVLRLTKGPDRGKLVNLRHWQGDLICDILRLDADGVRAYQLYELWIARKNSKSLLGAGLAIDGLFDELGAEVYSCAGDKDQAKLVFGEVKQAVQMDPELNKILNCYRDVIEYPANGSIYRALSAEAFTKEGLNPSRVLFDELHVQPNDELWNVMNQGSDTRRQPLTVSLSTFGVMTDRFGDDSLGYREYQRCKRIMSGAEVDPTTGCRIYENTNLECDHLDPANWAPGNPALGDFLLIDKMAATSRRVAENDFRTKRLNQWVTSAVAWLPAGAWGALDTKPVPEDGTRIVVGFDGSYTDDSTALIGCTVPDEGEAAHLFVIDIWESAGKPPGWTVPRESVDAAVDAAMRRWNVAELAADPPKWESEMERWEERYGEVVVRFDTFSRARMAPACNRLYAAVTEQNLTHDGSEALARHFGNAVTKQTPQGTVIVKDSKSSPRKIDAAVAAVVAHDRAVWHSTQDDSHPGVFVAVV